MNIQIFLQSILKLKPENIKCTKHFVVRHKERKDSLMPEIDDIRHMLVSNSPVAISEQGEDKFEILFNLNEKYDLALVLSVKSSSPEIVINYML